MPGAVSDDHTVVTVRQRVCCDTKVTLQGSSGGVDEDTSGSGAMITTVIIYRQQKARNMKLKVALSG